MIEFADKPNHRITGLSTVQKHYILSHAREWSVNLSSINRRINLLERPARKGD